MRMKGKMAYFIIKGGVYLRGRFVHDHDIAPTQNCSSQGDELAFAGAERASLTDRRVE